MYESNSKDETPLMLRDFGRSLVDLAIDHRIVSIPDDGRQKWPSDGSRERITYLSMVRNKVLEPIQSSNDSIRIPDWNEFTKIIFMNDVVYKWEDIARLVGTRLEGKEDEEYDMVCAVDHMASGQCYIFTLGRSSGYPAISSRPFA